MSIPQLIVLGNFLKQRPTGVQRYAIELTRALSARNPGRVTLLTPPGLEVPARLASVPAQPGSCWSALSRRLPGWAFLDAPLYLRLKGIGDGLVWNPSNIGAPHIPNQIITLHDLSVLEYPQYFSRSFRYKHQLAYAATLPLARCVMTVSHAMKAEIERRYPRLKGRVQVVYNGVSENFVAASPGAIQTVLQHRGIEQPYLLTVASVDPRKNSKLLVRAYVSGRIFEKTGVRLVLAGGRFASFREDPEFSSLLQKPGVMHLGYIADEELPALYSGCKAFVFPSLYEGFGIPVIEALACGAPVLCSDIPVFREIAGDAATYFPLGSLDGFVEALRRMATKSAGSHKASAISEKFSWGEAARIFEGVLHGLPPWPAKRQHATA